MNSIIFILVAVVTIAFIGVMVLAIKGLNDKLNKDLVHKNKVFVEETKDLTLQDLKSEIALLKKEYLYLRKNLEWIETKSIAPYQKSLAHGLITSYFQKYLIESTKSIELKYFNQYNLDMNQKFRRRKTSNEMSNN